MSIFEQLNWTEFIHFLGILDFNSTSWYVNPMICQPKHSDPGESLRLSHHLTAVERCLDPSPEIVGVDPKGGERPWRLGSWFKLTCCWWKKSCTSWGNGSLSHYLEGFSTIPGGAAFLPSTVCLLTDWLNPQIFFNVRVIQVKIILYFILFFRFAMYQECKYVCSMT